MGETAAGGGHGKEGVGVIVVDPLALFLSNRFSSIKFLATDLEANTRLTRLVASKQNMALSQQPRRHRSPSDPFSDPPAISYSSYGVPTLARNAPPQTKAPPPVPPKASKTRDRAPMATEITQTARTSSDNPRTRMNRSQTQCVSRFRYPCAQPADSVASATRTSPSRPVQPTSHRSLSQDSVLRAANTVEKAKATSRRAIPTKKGSSHADVIDRLDFSGVGPMFHHDGPFDACAPSRNRHRTRAPMLAWTGAIEEDKTALASAREIASAQSPYPSPAIYAPYEAPKKKHDAIAEAWGIHEPEPFEDFSAGGGYAGGAHSEFATPNGSSSKRDKERTREKHRERLEDQSRRPQAKRSPIPPPQPIFVSGEEPEGYNNPPSPTGAPASPGAPKRSKSLMHRIRKMRETPNVPPMQDDQAGMYEQDPSSPSSAENAGGSHAQYAQRPTHRSQNSFLGRFGGRRKDQLSPTDEAFVYVEPQPTRREKSLPAPPTRNGGSSSSEYQQEDYFTEGSGNLGRRTSLLKKVKGVVKG
ncbi:hypothetical protein EIP86_008952 [Pleurotus ostreatoroseus]|nr:hypothetical protein EIP86_008952 [Pleurotus ostreatoroseus]